MVQKLTLWGYGLQSPLKVHFNISSHLRLGLPNGPKKELFMVYETQGSMPHSQGLSNNPYPVPNQPNSSY